MADAGGSGVVRGGHWRHFLFALYSVKVGHPRDRRAFCGIVQSSVIQGLSTCFCRGYAVGHAIASMSQPGRPCMRGRARHAPSRAAKYAPANGRRGVLRLSVFVVSHLSALCRRTVRVGYPDTREPEACPDELVQDHSLDRHAFIHMRTPWQPRYENPQLALCLHAASSRRS